MADEFDTPDAEIKGLFVGTNQETGVSTYEFFNPKTGAKVRQDLGYTRDQLIPLLDSTKELLSPAGRSLAKTMGPVLEGLRSKDERGFGSRVAAPIARSIPAYLAGAIPDIGGLLSYVPGPTDLAAMGYEALTGDDPFGTNKRRGEMNLESRKFAEEYGSKAQQGRFSQYLRQADKWAQDNWDFRPFEDSIGTDMTPDARGFWEEILATALEMGLAGPFMVKGVVAPAKLLQDGAQYLFSKLSKESVKELGEAATSPENVRSLIDKANDAYSLLNKGGRRNIRQEFTFGFMGGAATEAALDGLKAVDPEAAGWVKASVAMSAGLFAPLVARSAVTSLLQGPIVRAVSSAVIDPVLRPGRAARSFVQKNLGDSMDSRAAVVSTSRLLEEAIANGRHVDAASGLAMTSPELARTEGAILRAEIKIKRDRLSQETDPKVQERLRKEIEADGASADNLFRTANFYEAILESAAKDRAPGVAARFFQDETKRLVQRRESFFNYIEGTFKRAYDDLDFNGKPGGTPDELRVDLQSARDGGVPEFEANRRTLVMEGNQRGVESSELLWLDPQTRQRVGAIEQDLSAKMDEALAKAQAAANGRVVFLNDTVDLYLKDLNLKAVGDLSAAERRMVGDLIRGTYDDAGREWRAFVQAAYRRVDGLDVKVTENIVFPNGSRDRSSNADISGMTVEQWAAKRFENFSPGEAFNMKLIPPQLAQLAGSRSLIAWMNRSRKEDAAAGRISNSEEAIPNLERRRDDAIAQRDEVDVRLNKQRDAERQLSEDNSRTLQTYTANAVENLDDAGKLAVLDFYGSPDMDWRGMSLDTAKGLAPKGLQTVFAEITRQRKRILELGEGVTSSAAVRSLDTEMAGFAVTAKKAQADIDDITNKALGLEDGVVVPPTGRLTARGPDGDVIRKGTSADDVVEFITELGDAARAEKALNGATTKYRNINQIRDTVEQLLNPKNFPDLDLGKLKLAKEADRVRRALGDSQGTVLDRSRGSGVKVEVENVAEAVLPGQTSAPAAAAKLRQLQEATAELPDFVTVNRGADGKTVATINEAALGGDTSLFARADSPFEMIQVGQAGTPFELRIKQNAPVSPRSLEIAEAIVLERLSLKFPDGVDSKGLDSFRKNNKAAIKFLKDNGPPDAPEKRTVVGLINDADSLAVQLDAIKNLRRDKAGEQLTELVNRGEFDLNGFKIDDYLDYIGQRRSRVSDDNAFSEVLGADPGLATDALFRGILDTGNSRPKKDIQEFLSIIRGNKAAERGLQASIIGQIWKRSLTRTDSLIRETADLSMQAFDPARFRELIGNQRVQTIIREAFPDNPAIIPNLEKMALSAFETSNFTQGGKILAAVDPANAVNLTGWAFLGRITALGAANRTNLVNQLWAGAAGSKFGKRIGLKVTAGRVKDIMIDAALYPAKGAELGLRVGQQSNGFWATLGQTALDVVTIPPRRPGASLSIIERGEEELDEPGGMGDRSSVQPAGPPPRRMGADMKLTPPVPSSSLSQASGTGQAPAPTGQQPAAPPRTTGTPSPDVVQQGQQLFGPNDPVFGPGFRHGGYVTGGAGSGVGRMEESGIMSVPRKPRQLVG
jgi:hypothetical protein